MILKPELLLTAKRSGLIDAQTYGFWANYSAKGFLCGTDKTDNYPFFLRSLAKPIQASLLEDFKTNEYFGFNSEQIALFCASHTAQNYHLELVRSVLKKIGLDETALLCGTHPPFAPREDALNTPIHNNCSGKHALMLALCVQNGWNIADYCNLEHPLQKLIYKKHLELSGEKELKHSFDGCSAPVWAMSLEATAKSFLNLFERYKLIKNAFLAHPLIIGAQNRTDSKIMLASPNLVAKVGAGGFLLVYNVQKCEALVIRLMQADYSARELIASYILNRLGWLDEPICEQDIKNIHGTPVGEYIFCDNIGL